MMGDIDIHGEEKEAFRQIREIKAERGESLLILGHHYQRRQIISLSDYIGDSYALSARAAASGKARNIVFCGVAFMAESAAILSSPGQTVHHPNFSAGCPMADMASLEDVETAFEAVSSRASGTVIPIVYMNSGSEIKAFCGRHGGLVCTSSNAGAAFKWAFTRGKVVLFIPDEHLGTNTADALEIPEDARTLYDPASPGGGEDFAVRDETILVQWKGYCHVHTHFTPRHVHEARRNQPGCTVVVHPECPREVASLADVVGSTTKIVETVENSPEGQALAIGTEVNLVDRLAREYAGRKRVFPLSRSFCPNMFRINLSNLLDTLRHLEDGRQVVTVRDETARHAALALKRMLEIT